VNGGEQRYATGFVDYLAEDDVEAIKERIVEAFARGIPATHRSEQVDEYLKRPQILEMIKHQREVYNWDFLFLGANQDAIKAGSAIGISADHAATFDEAPGGPTQAFAAVSEVIGTARIGGENYTEHLKKAAKKK
jgi:hypothetical protein